jgi:hypothetical protein
MLIRIPVGGEPSGLRLNELPFAVLRVRHPLPACTRIAVMRPAVILVGSSVQPRDFDLVARAAEDVGAAAVLVDGLVDTLKLHDWVATTVVAVIAKRQQRAEPGDAEAPHARQRAEPETDDAFGEQPSFLGRRRRILLEGEVRQA